MTKLTPVLLAGGEGRRLAPLSTPERPKQFLRVGERESLLQQAALRALMAAPAESVVTVTSARYADAALAELAAVDAGLSRHVIAEPCPRNTAAALIIAALYIKEHIGEALLWALPCDHYIENEAALRDAVNAARPPAAAGHIVTFGIVPTRADTGYGYILYEEAAAKYGIYKVQRFVEKPGEAAAQALIDAGNCLWNSGMFVCSADTLLEAMRQHSPEILAACKRARSGMDEALYSAIPASPIDKAVMEKVENLVVMPLNAGWADIGTKEAFARFSQVGGA